MKRRSVMARRNAGFGALALVGLALAVGVTGCMTQGRITPEHVEKLKAAPEVEAVRKRGAFLQMQTLKGVIGGALMASVIGVGVIPNAAADIQKEHGLQDPMLIVMPAVLERLEKQGAYRISVAPETEDGPKATKPHQLQFKTVYWGMGSQNSEDTPLGYSYTAEIALVDTSKTPSEDQWRVQCLTDEKTMAPKVKLAELTANGAALLKERIAQEAQRCVERLFDTAPAAKN